MKEKKKVDSGGDYYTMWSESQTKLNDWEEQKKAAEDEAVRQNAAGSRVAQERPVGDIHDQYRDDLAKHNEIPRLTNRITGKFLTLLFYSIYKSSHHVYRWIPCTIKWWRT